LSSNKATRIQIKMFSLRDEQRFVKSRAAEKVDILC
jgi:hypothetical protein